MRWLPVVEGFIAVLDRSEDGGYEVCCEEKVEGGDGLENEGAWWGPEDDVSAGLARTDSTRRPNVD